MAKTANLFTRVIIDWVSPGGYEREVEVEVDYTFDGDELRITKTVLLGMAIGIGEWELEEAVWEAVSDQADEAYAEWVQDYGDYLYEQAIERRAAAA